MAKAYWVECCVGNCEQKVCSDWPYRRDLKCHEHLKQERIEKELDRAWEKQHDSYALRAAERGEK